MKRWVAKERTLDEVYKWYVEELAKQDKDYRISTKTMRKILKHFGNYERFKNDCLTKTDIEAAYDWKIPIVMMKVFRLEWKIWA